jgi:hypothetical protein
MLGVEHFNAVRSRRAARTRSTAASSRSAPAAAAPGVAKPLLEVGVQGALDFPIVLKG